MKKVQFEFERVGSMIVYPDDIALFSGAHQEGNFMVADYSGDLPLDDYTPAPKRITIIPEYDFRLRFTPAERVSFDNSPEPVIVTMREDLRAASSMNGGIVDLEYQPVIDGVNAMVTVGILADQTRADEVLRIEEQ